MAKKKQVPLPPPALVPELTPAIIPTAAPVNLSKPFDNFQFKQVLSKLKIKPKGPGLIPFIPNRHQQAFYDRIETNRLLGRPTRELHVKDRQVGDTTGIAAFFCADCFEQGPIENLVVAANDKSQRKIWRIYDRFIKNYFKDADALEPEPDPLEKGGKKSKVRYHSKQEWESKEHGSLIGIEIATEAASRGGTSVGFHGSECDYWDNFDDTFEAIMSQVPDVPESVAVLETTLDSRHSSEFRKFVEDTRDGKTGWTLVFIGWLEHEEYTRPFESKSERAEFLDTMDKEEKGLYEARVPLEKLNWRRYAIRMKFKGRADRFRREFPMTLDEALMYKGEGYFSQLAMDYYRNHVRQPIEKMVPGIDKQGKWQMYEWDEEDEDHHPLKIWKEPQPGHAYVMGGDTAEDDENTVAGMAESFAVVGDVDTGEVVATWHGRLPPVNFGETLYSIGMYYNRAHLNPENNSIGGIVIQKLLDLHYPNLATTERYAEHEEGEFHFVRSIGFRTGPRTRQILLRNLQGYVNTMRLDIPDEYLVKQMMLFVERKPGAPRKASAKGRDDGVIALALFCIASNKSDRWRWRGEKQMGKESEVELKKRGVNVTNAEIDRLRKLAERQKIRESLRSMYGQSKRYR